MRKALFGAIQFLTIYPVRGPVGSPGESAALFPLVGAMLGLLGALVWNAGNVFFSPLLASLLVLALWAFLTGGLHEDGLADVGDALRSYRSRDQMLAILRDSRIGAHGALVLVFGVLLRWQALSALVAEPMSALAAAQGLPRAALVALAWISRPAGSKLAAALNATLTTPLALIAIAQGFVLALLCGYPASLWLIAGTVILVLAARRYFYARLGGVNGDCLGALSQTVETYVLLVFACRVCI